MRLKRKSHITSPQGATPLHAWLRLSEFTGTDGTWPSLRQRKMVVVGRWLNSSIYKAMFFKQQQIDPKITPENPSTISTQQRTVTVVTNRDLLREIERVWSFAQHQGMIRSDDFITQRHNVVVMPHTRLNRQSLTVKCFWTFVVDGLLSPHL